MNSPALGLQASLLIAAVWQCALSNVARRLHLRPPSHSRQQNTTISPLSNPTERRYLQSQNLEHGHQQPHMTSPFLIGACCKSNCCYCMIKLQSSNSCHTTIAIVSGYLPKVYLQSNWCKATRKRLISYLLVPRPSGKVLVITSPAARPDNSAMDTGMNGFIQLCFQSECACKCKVDGD